MDRRAICWAIAVGTAVLALAQGFSASGAAADTGVICAPSQNIVSDTPPGYARQGAEFSLALHATDPMRVSNTNVSFSQGSSLVSTEPVSFSAPTTDVTVAAPSTGTMLSVVIAWDQDGGTSAACSASVSVTIPLIPAAATAGDPAQRRLAGSFTVVEKPVNYRAADSRPTWRLTPGCAYFACAVKLQSSQGLQLTLARLSTGLYHGHLSYGAEETATSCTVPHLHLFTIANAYTSREDVYVRIARFTDGVVTRISGSLIAVYTPTRAARRQGCVATERAIEQFTGGRTQGPTEA
jgi:hypothetical protein